MDIELHLGDCLEIMSDLPSTSVNLIFCDLPYGITSNKWDSIIPLDKLWEQYERILKPNGIVALNAVQPFSSMLVMSNLKMFRHEWVWIKNRGSNFANTVREPFKEHEKILLFSKEDLWQENYEETFEYGDIIIFSRGKWTYNKQMQERAESGKSRVKYDFNHITETENYKKFNRPSDSKGKDLRVPSSVQKFNVEVGLHPTQKPIGLAEYIIKTYSNEGDLVLDNCMGSGTYGLAAKNLNRDFIGIDKNQEYFNIAKQRIYEY